MPDGNGGLLAASPDDQTMILCGKVAVLGVNGCVCCFDQGGAQPGTTFAGPTTQALASNLPAQMRNRFVHTVNMGELLLDQETMVSSETALQGLGKQVTFRTHASTRQFGQGAGVSLSLK